MTRKCLLTIFSALMLLVPSLPTHATTKLAARHSIHRVKEPVVINRESKSSSATSQEDAGAGARAEEMEKKQKPASEELAHIHHFHKERVKKIKRFHKKYWALSKVVLVLCHLALLVIAYLHLMH